MPRQPARRLRGREGPTVAALERLQRGEGWTKVVQGQGGPKHARPEAPGSHGAAATNEELLTRQGGREPGCGCTTHRRSPIPLGKAKAEKGPQASQALSPGLREPCDPKATKHEPFGSLRSPQHLGAGPQTPPRLSSGRTRGPGSKETPHPGRPAEKRSAPGGERGPWVPRRHCGRSSARTRRKAPRAPQVAAVTPPRGGAPAAPAPRTRAGTQRPQCDWRSCQGTGRAAATDPGPAASQATSRLESARWAGTRMGPPGRRGAAPSRLGKESPVRTPGREYGESAGEAHSGPGIMGGGESRGAGRGRGPRVGPVTRGRGLRGAHLGFVQPLSEPVHHRRAGPAPAALAAAALRPSRPRAGRARAGGGQVRGRRR